MELNLDNTRLRTLIPNIIHEVEDETTLFDKIYPWLETARIWLETEILGQYQPQGELRTLAEKIIVYKAFADAIPSLDVTLSPAGFAVISTEGLAPASKERIERLIASLNSFVDANIISIVYELLKHTEWISSPIGQMFRSTFIPHLGDTPRFRRDMDLLDTYKSMREIALDFEAKLAEQYLGNEFLSEIRSAYPDFDEAGTKDIYEKIRTAELCYISFRLRSPESKLPDPSRIWRLVRPILARLDYWPELKARWQEEMGETLNVEPFKNTVKGGYYF